VTFNDDPLPIGAKFPYATYGPVVEMQFPWGKARLYAGPNRGTSYNLHVLSNGLWQFDTDIKKAGNPFAGIEQDFYLDVQSEVPSGTPGYPFSLDRQTFSPHVVYDFKKIFNYVSLLYANQEFVSNVRNYGEMQYLSRDASGNLEISPKTRLQLSAPLPDAPLGMIRPGDKVKW
jgi:hypothetical protein